MALQQVPNYLQGIQGNRSPLESAISGAKGLQGIQQNKQVLQSNRAAAEQQEAFRTSYGEMLSSGNLDYGALAAQYPEQLEAIESQRTFGEQIKQDAFIQPVMQMREALERGDIEGAGMIIAQNADQINAMGDPSFTAEHAFSMLQDDPEAFKQMTEGLIWQAQGAEAYAKGRGMGAEEGADLPSPVRETQWFLKQPKDVQDKHIILKRKSDPTFAEQLEQDRAKSDIKVEEEGRKVTAKSQSERRQGFIDSGVEAADAIGGIARARELLDSVETGGWDAAALRAKQIFGIESADEAELSAKMGKAILAQLKPIFGAAFTAAEGERLERIEARFGKSTEGNKRLLEDVKKITERAARRGLRAAKDQGDEFAAQEIQAALDALTSLPAPDDEVIEDGYRYLGGDKSNPASWEKV